jgi:hypothetical protein
MLAIALAVHYAIGVVLARANASLKSGAVRVNAY